MIIINILITFVIYMSIPFVFVKIGKPMSRMKMNLLSFFNLIIGMMVSGVIIYILSNGSRILGMGGALLWTVVGNTLMKKKLSLEEDPSDIRFREKEARRQQKIEDAIKSGKYSSREAMDKRQGIIGLCIIAVVIIGFIPIMLLVKKMFNI